MPLRWEIDAVESVLRGRRRYWQRAGKSLAAAAANLFYFLPIGGIGIAVLDDVEMSIADDFAGRGMTC